MFRPSIISLCCGAGLAALGYESYFHTSLAIDNWWWAYLSHLANHSTTPILFEDVGQNDVIQHVCALVANIRGVIAAPPCPTFSTANGLTPQQRALDPRGWVYVNVLDYVEHLQPDFLISENVEAAKNSFQFLVATARLERLGYNWDAWVLDAADFGVPQHRARLFLVAAKIGLPFPKCPLPTHGAESSSLLPYLTLGDAIGDLAEEESVASGLENISRGRKRILSQVPPGGNYRCLPTNLLAQALDSVGWRKPNEQLCGRLDYSKVPGTLRTGPGCKRSTFSIHPGYPFNSLQPDETVRFGNFRKTTFSQPSLTLLTNPSRPASRNLLIRPEHTRCLSVLEYLRIQGIRTPFQLFGGLRDRYRLVGNGIPPLLMATVCEAVHRALYGKQAPPLAEPTLKSGLRLHFKQEGAE